MNYKIKKASDDLFFEMKFKKRDNPFYENDIKGMKKREEAVKQGVVVNDLVKIKRKGLRDDEE